MGDVVNLWEVERRRAAKRSLEAEGQAIDSCDHDWVLSTVNLDDSETWRCNLCGALKAEPFEGPDEGAA